MTSSVTSSVACARYEDKLHDQKCDQLIGLIDSVLRRNKEGDSSGDDDVLFGEEKERKSDSNEIADVVTGDMYEYDPTLVRKNKNEFQFNSMAHQHEKIFKLIAAPGEFEKLPVVAIKIVDNLLKKQIPEILDFFIFRSLRRVLQRTDWLKPASEEITMTPIDELKRNFIKKFPFAAETNPTSVALQMSKVSLTYYLDNENFVTGDPKENFDPRKTKIKDEGYQSLFDQLVSDWYESEIFESYDD